MFLQPEDLKSAIYQYRVDDITADDEDIVLIAIQASIQEVQSYFTPNFKPEWSDGRFIYDVEAIFSAEGTERNPLILQHTKTIAVWNLIELSNVDMIFEQVRIRYERAVEWLKDFASGKVTLNNLPLKEVEVLDDDGKPMQRDPFKFGSRKKFHHE